MPLHILEKERGVDYAGAVRAAIRAGGCNASRAAIVGAFVAAYQGLDAIPARWIAHLPAAVIDDCKALVARAVQDKQ